MLSQPLIREITSLQTCLWRSPEFDARRLAVDLRHTIEGDGRFYDGSDVLRMRLYHDLDVEHHLWKTGESGLGVTARVPGTPDTWEGWEDSALPSEKLDRTCVTSACSFKSMTMPGNFTAIWRSCVHTRIDIDLTARETFRNSVPLSAKQQVW